MTREKGLEKAAEHLGHSSINTTRIYAKLDERELERWHWQLVRIS